MKLQKKTTKKIESINKDLFEERDEENLESEEEIKTEEEEADSKRIFHKLNWVTNSNFYDSAIQVKEINNYF